MGTVAPPQLTLAIGTVVIDAQKKHKWVFTGYRKTTVSTQLVFVDTQSNGWTSPSSYQVVNRVTMENKFPGIIELSKTQPHVRKVLDLSTAHVKQTTSELLTLCSSHKRSFPVICYEKGEYGFMVYVPDEPDKSPNWNSVPSDLQVLMLVAYEYECDWLMLDRDGVTVDYLPTWEW